MARTQYSYYDFVMAAFVCIMICSNFIGAGKVFTVAGLSFGGGILFFPLSYLFGVVLTEVYCYSQAFRVVWAGFGALLFASFVSWIVVQLPPAEGWPHQAAYETVFGASWRIVAASLIGYFFGEFCNSYVIAKMKVMSNGKHLWFRFIASTVAGEAVDTLIFYPIAFYGLWSNDLLVSVMLSSYGLKVLWEVVATPFTVVFVRWLKRAENEDYYDRATNFNPFSLM